MPIDLEPYKGVLPYASELYGIYQPLLGWRSRRSQQRIEAGIQGFKTKFLASLPFMLAPDVHINPRTLHPREVEFRVGVAQEAQGASPLLRVAPQSLIARHVFSAVESAGAERPDVWRSYTRPAVLEEALVGLDDDIKCAYEQELRRAQTFKRALTDQTQRQILNSILARESVTAGMLATLGARNGGSTAAAMFSSQGKRLVLEDAVGAFEALVSAVDPRESELARAVVSPVGIVHLFRQYFFEFDSFLGPSVEHLWLSPGGMVELVEVSTRKTIIEQLTETAMESLLRTEKSLTMEDELSEAVKRQNSSSTKFGVSVNTETSFSLGSIFTSQIDTGTTYDLASNQQEARESLHKAARQQTEHIATEMRRSFKSTFRTTTEVTDTRSRKYVIRNDTLDLMNYELRRKMRQVGVQMQDYGTFMCWQTYVDKPGDQLGLANLVHIAVPNDMPPLVQPDLPAEPQPYKGDTIKHHFRWYLSDAPAFSGLDPEHFADVHAGDFPIVPNAGFRLERVEVKIIRGESWGFIGRG
ncbi:MAG: hypothetical protein ACREMA_07825, partial [Longimicrobiales bacterium]